MDFLVHGRATSAAMEAADDPELDERHWAYMDRFAYALTARGPTLGPDRQTWTGSIHIVGLPSPEAAHEFVAREPYNRAGAYEHHFVWQFTNMLGRTMWQFAAAADEPRYFVLASSVRVQTDPEPCPLANLEPQLRERLIVYGALRNLDDGAPDGVALAVQAPSREALDTWLGDGLAWLARYDDVAVHDWEFGGRR